MKHPNQIKRPACPDDCRAADAPCGCGYLPHLPCRHPVYRHQQKVKDGDVSAENAHPARQGRAILPDPASAPVATAA